LRIFQRKAPRGHELQALFLFCKSFSLEDTSAIAGYVHSYSAATLTLLFILPTVKCMREHVQSDACLRQAAGGRGFHFFFATTH
jgi:hypothetical protein